VHSIQRIYHRPATRGHGESEDTSNAGHFLNLLKLIGDHNDTVGNRLAEVPRNAKYTSKDIQNELIEVMARIIQTSIADEVRKSGEFCIMADESKDSRKNRANVN